MPAPEEDQPAQSRLVLMEVRECGACLGPVVYWDGDFRHLASTCPSSLIRRET
jgi:hypothetical protein